MNKLVTLNNYNSFIIIKPGFLDFYEEIIQKYVSEGFRPLRILKKILTYEEASRIYSVHKNEDFYEELVKYMSSGMSIGIVFYKQSKTPTADTRRIKNYFRDEYSKSNMKNVLHSSDNLKNMMRESFIYFN